MKPAPPSTLFYLGFLGMELSYLYIVASLLSGPAYALIAMLLLYPLAFLSRVTPRRSEFSHRLRLALEVALVTGVMVLVTREQLVSSLATGQVDVLGIILRIGLCGLMWLMGHTVPHERVNYSTIAFRLQIGILAVLVFSQVKGSVPPVFLFFLLAPLALFLARWASSFSRGATALGAPNPGHLLLTGASTLVPGMALILVFSPDLLRSILSWLGSISAAILAKLDAWIMAQHEAAATLPGDFRFVFSCSKPPVDETPPPTDISPLPPGDAAGVSPVVLWVILSVIFLATVVLIAFALKRRRAPRKVQPVESVRFQLRTLSLNMLRSLISFFPQLLKKLWLRLILIFQKWKKPTKPPEEALISIRALYRGLLRWAARQGVARLPFQTPLEHLAVLEQGFPQQQNDLRRITDAYLLARYSRTPVSREEFDRARHAWQRIVAYQTRTQVRG
jgi:hypothetical protein